jgi:hypothetical protein
MCGLAELARLRRAALAQADHLLDLIDRSPRGRPFRDELIAAVRDVDALDREIAAARGAAVST